MAFPAADAAYLLSFAIIMLNTDAHNPLAEGRISADDFVTMCMYQTAEGEFEQILPREELLLLYQRILERELGEEAVEHGGGIETKPKTDGGARAGAGQNRRTTPATSGTRSRLASALGLGQLSAPFWSGNPWDKQHGVDIERKRLLDMTAKILAVSATPGGIGGTPGIASGSFLWHTATHAEHARPMMQVCGDAVCKALAAGLRASTSIIDMMPVLDGYEQAIRLAALLRIEPLCETLVSGLAEAAALESPAPPRSAAEARHVAALARLTAIGTSSDAGALGSAWVVIFRVLSELEALKSRLTIGGSSTAASSSSPAGAMSSSMTALKQRLAHPIRSTAAAFKSTGGTTGNTAAAIGATAANIAPPVTPSGQQQQQHRLPASNALSVRDDPGMGPVVWAVTAGAGPIDAIFGNSASLDGDAVLTFARALCAVSQEELDSFATPSISPQGASRVYLLQRLVEFAFLNMDRIRLVWRKLWTVISQHLVSAACQGDTYVAMYAVDSLRQFADRLLERDELAGFSSQGDALRPLGAVLRCSDAVAVRELSIACVSHAMSSHGDRIAGSGWRAAIEAVAVAVADPLPAVVTQALDSMSVAIASLYDAKSPAVMRGNHMYLKECVGAALAAVSNSTPAIDELSFSSVFLFKTLADRVSQAQRAQQEKDDAWVVVLSPLATIARVDTRKRVADAAAAVLFGILKDGGVRCAQGEVDPATWLRIFDRAIKPLLSFVVNGADDQIAALPPPPPPRPSAGVPATETTEGMDSHDSSVPLQQLPVVPPPPQQQQQHSVARRPTFFSTSSDHVTLPYVSSQYQSIEGPARILRHATAHLPDLWTVFRDRPASVGTTLLAPALGLLRGYAETDDDEAAALGAKETCRLLEDIGPDLDEETWNKVERVLSSTIDLSISSGTGDSDGSETVRRRCRSSLSALRCIGEMLHRSSKTLNPNNSSSSSRSSQSRGVLPANVRLRLLGIVQRAVESAATFNNDEIRRLALWRVLHADRSTSVTASGGDDAVDNTTKNGSSRNSGGSLDVDVLGLAHAVSATASVWDTGCLLPALIRQEIEGGRILLQSLERMYGDSSGMGAKEMGDDDLKMECESRLLSFAVSVLRKSVNAMADTSSSSSVSSAPAVSADDGGSLGGPPPARAMSKGAVSLPSDSWEEAMRGPLVADALKALCALPIEAWKELKQEVFRISTILVCSHDLEVRKAVKELMKVQGKAAMMMMMGK